MAYELIALLTDGSDLDLERLTHLLRERFASVPGAVVRLEEYPRIESQYVAVRWGDWSFRLSYEDKPHVREESQEIAEAYGGSRPDRGLIAGCRRRISMVADDDPGMDHFNDYCFIVQRLEKQPGVILFDPQAQDFIDN
jgi:hypothetical protein